MARVCVQHPFEHSENLCGQCGLEYCRNCLVYPHGPRKLPLCVPCALSAGGVRAAARTKSGLSKREIKQRAKERRREEKALAKLQRDPVTFPEIANPFEPGWAVQDEPESGEPLPPPLTGWENDPLAPAPAPARAGVEPDPAPAPEPLAPEPVTPALGDPALEDAAPEHAGHQAVTLANLAAFNGGLFGDPLEGTDPQRTDGSGGAWGTIPKPRRDDQRRSGTAGADVPHVSFLDEVFAGRDKPTG
jgi:hypothetical protein